MTASLSVSPGRRIRQHDALGTRRAELARLFLAAVRNWNKPHLRGVPESLNSQLRQRLADARVNFHLRTEEQTEWLLNILPSVSSARPSAQPR